MLPKNFLNARRLKNLVFVNGEKVESRELQNGDAITFGLDDSYEIIFRNSIGAGTDVAVETAFGSVRVYDANAKRVDSGTTLHTKPSEVGVMVPKLDRGTYTVAWRVISADTHPVHGAFTFSVGAASGNPKDVAAQILASEKTPRYVSLMFDVDRFVNFFLILFVVGGVAVIAFVVRDAALRVRRLIELVVAAAAALLVPASLFGLVLEATGGYAVSWLILTTVAVAVSLTLPRLSPLVQRG